MSDRYRAFIEAKSQLAGEFGFAPTFSLPQAYDFQAHLIDWSCRQGRAAIFADCGLGKTPIQLTWAHNVTRHSNKAVLVLAPLSVSIQTVEEAEKFGLEAQRSLQGAFRDRAGIITTNYERLHHFNPDDFGGVVCDESSILKNFDGERREAITEFMRRVKYRLLCTATAAPNDYTELGTSSEALGQLGHMDMLGRFFKNDQDSLHPAFIGSPWRFKHHAERDFWRWVCSWARACRKPSDLGFEDGRFVLPDLITEEHVVESGVAEGALFPLPASNLQEEREERRSSLKARCEKAAELLQDADCAVAWCQLNDEADLLVKLIPGAEQISGADTDERKEELFEAFRHGQLSRLVTKPQIAAFGMNWQHCNRMTYFPDHSFERYYQSVRRFWRFGQTSEVRADLVTSQSNRGSLQNLKRKAEACEAMFGALVEQMNNALRVSRYQEHTTTQEIPAWL